jgi:predicted outer membrane repeat protein
MICTQLRKLVFRKASAVSPRRPTHRPAVTELEGRLAPAILTVNSVADAPISALSPTLELREAIALVNGHGAAFDAAGRSLAQAKASQIDVAQPFGSTDTIRFDPALFDGAPQVITVAGGELILGQNVTLQGPGAARLALDGNAQTTVLEILGGTSANVAGLTIEHGSTLTFGGGVVNHGTLTLADSALTGNLAIYGGGIANDGVLSLQDTTVSDSLAFNSGGGIYSTGTLSLLDSAVLENVAEWNDGGLVSYGGATVLVDSIVSGNAAGVGNGGLANYGGAMALVGSTVSGNSALAAGGLGNYGGTMTIRASNIVGNVATGAQGGGILNMGTLTIADSVLAGNWAPDGGALLNTAITDLVDTTLAANGAGSGANDIDNAFGTLRITHSDGSDPALTESAGSIVNAGELVLGQRVFLPTKALSDQNGVLDPSSTNLENVPLTLVESVVTGDASALGDSGPAEDQGPLPGARASGSTVPVEMSTNAQAESSASSLVTPDAVSSELQQDVQRVGWDGTVGRAVDLVAAPVHGRDDPAGSASVPLTPRQLPARGTLPLFAFSGTNRLPASTPGNEREPSGNLPGQRGFPVEAIARAAGAEREGAEDSRYGFLWERVPASIAQQAMIAALAVLWDVRPRQRRARPGAWPALPLD